MFENNYQYTIGVPKYLRDVNVPQVDRAQLSISRQNINANNFEHNLGVIQIVQTNQFGGLINDEPNLDLASFLKTYDIVKMNGIYDDRIHLHLFYFSFSLRDKAKDWL